MYQQGNVSFDEFLNALVYIVLASVKRTHAKHPLKVKDKHTLHIFYLPRGEEVGEYRVLQYPGLI